MLLIFTKKLQKENLYNFTLLTVQCNFIEEILRIVEVQNINRREILYIITKYIYIKKISKE